MALFRPRTLIKARMYIRPLIFKVNFSKGVSLTQPQSASFSDETLGPGIAVYDIEYPTRLPILPETHMQATSA
jgi:hypothetical protein